MSRTLVISTFAGLLVCGLSLGAAVLIGGENIFHNPRSLESVKPLIDLATHKTWRWNGGDTLALDAPINIRYQPKGPAQVSVTGPAEAIEHVRVTQGRIAADTGLSRSHGRRVEAVVSGIPIRRFVVNPGETLDLGEIKQPELDLHINGDGAVTGSGEVGQLKLVVAGPGEAKLGALSVLGDAKISILGSGNVALSPHGSVRLFIAGSGNLDLLTRPAELHKTILGSGDVNQLSEEAARNALKSIDVGRIASDAARDAIQSSLGNSRIGEIASEAARKGIENAQIERHVREGLDRGLGQPPAPPAPPPPPSGAWFGHEVSRTDDSATIRGSHDVDLGHIEQQNFKVSVFDSGSATAEGKVDKLRVAVFGSGHVNLGRLAAGRVEVMIAGSGDVTVAPRDELKVNIMGSGDVHLMTRPAAIQQRIMGSGHIIPPP